MKPYTFYIHDAGHPTPAFDFVHCDDDSDALEHARLLLARYPQYQQIEVFDGRHDRLTVRREVQALDA
jgi:hypothetical protein